MTRPRKPRTAIVGAGRLGRALARAVSRAGYRLIGVAARRPSAARLACRGLRGARATTRPTALARDARLVLLAVPDAAVAEVAGMLARARIDWAGRCVLHHAGALGLEPLEPLAHAGAAVGVLHPLQCLGDDPRAAAALLRGSRARIEGVPTARAIARTLARDVGLVPLRFARRLGARDRLTYHAAAAVGSNDLVALFDLALGLLESTGLSRRDARLGLLALARGTLDQIERGDVDAALTGPVARGDVGTLAGHIETLSLRSEEDAEAHRVLSRRLARLARRLERIDPGQLRRLLRLTGPANER